MFKKFLNKISFSRLFFSIIFSIALFFMSKIVFLGYTFDENYIEHFLFKEFSILLIYIPVVYFLLYFLEKHYMQISNIIVAKEDYKNKKTFCIIAFIFLLLVYLIYFFSFYPGGVYIDTWTSLKCLWELKNLHHNNLYYIL